MPLEVFVQKNTAVTLHQQLITQISMQIAAGLLKPGEKLPSVRSLSRKLDVHYNTCLSAYNHLAEIGLITLKQGSGARVGGSPDEIYPEGLPPGIHSVFDDLALNQLARYFVELSYRRGFAWEDVRQAVLVARSHLEQAHTYASVIYVDLHADIIPLFERELTQALNLPVRGVTLGELESELAYEEIRRWMAEDVRFVVSRYHAAALKKALRRTQVSDAAIASVLHVIDVNSAKNELALVKTLPPDKLMVVVSDSDIVLRQAEAVVTALKGEDVLLRLVSLSEGKQAIEQAVRHGALIFADVLALEKIRELSDKKIYPLRVIPEPVLDELAKKLFLAP